MPGLRWLVLLCVPALVVSVNVGCMKCGRDVAERTTKKALETAVEKATGGKVNIDASGSIDVSAIPEFARYPGAKPTTRWSMSVDKGTGSVFLFEIPDPRTTVADWYKKNLEASGWKQTAIIESGEVTSFVYKAPNEEDFLNVSVSAKGGTTIVNVMVSKQPK